jgi:hypothetical protein
MSTGELYPVETDLRICDELKTGWWCRLWIGIDGGDMLVVLLLCIEIDAGLVGVHLVAFRTSQSGAQWLQHWGMICEAGSHRMRRKWQLLPQALIA